MNEQRIWDYTIGALIGAALAIMFVLVMDWASPVRVRTVQTSSVSIETTRMLRCEEDEDIVTSLDGRGLPAAFCKQVIER